MLFEIMGKHVASFLERLKSKIVIRMSQLKNSYFINFCPFPEEKIFYFYSFFNEIFIMLRNCLLH